MNEGASLVLPCYHPASRPPANVYWGTLELNGTWTALSLTQRITQDREGKYYGWPVRHANC